VPDPVKDEFVNIGVMLREPFAAEEHAAAGAGEKNELRFTRDWTRVRCIDPQADVSMLEALESEVRERMEVGPETLQLLRDSLSNVVQITEPKACLAETFQTQMEQLMRMYVEVQKLPREKRRTGRVAIHGEMRRRFELEGVWGLMKKHIAAAQYTQVGDPLLIDCGYRPNGVVRMFQAVSLENDVEGAKGLAFSAPYMSEGVQRVEGASLQLTAIVEAIREIGEEQERVDQYRFGVEMMERQQIRVLTVSDLERVAATARLELLV
jgi:hypothetical protein